MIKKPYGENDPHALVELIAYTNVVGDKFTADQMPSLAARVSHAQSGKTGDDKDADKRLMNFLAEHSHLTPFEHTSITFKVVLPIFVTREWHRHRTQSYNEVSMRYSANPVGKMFKPEMWREQADRNKQSSAGNIKPFSKQCKADDIIEKAYRESIVAYEKLIDLGVCREQARIVVPVGNYTEMYASANLRNWGAFCKLRMDKDAQYEIRVYADAINEIISEVYPDSWGVIQKHLL